ncbi:MAG: NADPH-dependent assimilatory sulfite reductase hemoprotein subunit [Inquilinaceae bacterium]
MDASLPSPAVAKLSAVEQVKRSSRHLRGTIGETVADAQAPVFSEGDAQLLKTHGIYQQYDRDTATARKQRGEDRDHRFMVRLRVPGGRLTADQYLALDTLAGELANGTLRITTRQTFQFHGVLKGDLHALMNRINGLLVTTMAACGDVARNVMATPAPVGDAVHRIVNDVADTLSSHLLPRTRAYHEIWVDGEKQDLSADTDEPLYGDTYLPRKFKIAVATPDDNSVDVLTNDVGIVALFEGNRLSGYNVAVGGGLGMTHNKPKTYPRLATPLLFVEPDGLVGAVEAIVKMQRDHGDRSDRRHARLKYLVDDRGLPWIKDTVERYAGRSYDPPRKMPRFRIVDHMGWHPQNDGTWYLGLPVASGRIVDGPDNRLRTALREVIDRYRPGIVLCPSQDILLSDIAADDRDGVEAALRAHGVVFAADISPLARWALACPALPTCGLALTEAERVRQPLVAAIEERLSAHGLADETISLRITGCPNGCARPYAGDIGLVGRMPGHYALYVGGDFEGTRLNTRLLDKVAEADVATVLDPLFAAFAAERQAIEGFGDFCNRVGTARLAALIDAAMPSVAI